jgi:hypothetical protein
VQYVATEGRGYVSTPIGRGGLFVTTMLRRLSEWQYHDGGSYLGTPWDPREKDWEPGGVQYDWCMTEEDTWVQNSSRFRIVEIYYDASDRDLPVYEEPYVETKFLTVLPDEIVQSHIWLQVIQGFGPLQSIQAMVQVRRVCRAWRSWVDHNDDWMARVEGHLVGAAGCGRPWHYNPRKLTAVKKAVEERGLTITRDC